MAGGPFAAFVACPECLWEHKQVTKATRVYEGVEDDQYVCDREHRFGVDWARGPATEPQWPAPPELVAAAMEAEE
jgi:hypothetical protein